jgi:hypothetical protein
MKEFNLLPGESFTTEVIADIFLYEYLNKKAVIQIGYGFNLKKNNFEKFWSEPLQITESVKDEIIRNAPHWLKNQGK